MNIPETHFVEVGSDRVAWQQLGEGRDLVIASGLWSHLDLLWEEPDSAAAYRHLAGFSRLIRYDRRGSGLSDPVPDDSRRVEHWIDDLDAVLDAAKSTQAVILAIGDSGLLALRYYAARRGRVSGLILINTTASLIAAPDYPEGHPPEAVREVGLAIRARWGREEADAIGTPGALALAGTVEPTPAQLRLVARLQRAMAPPKAVQANLTLTAMVDGRDILPYVDVPTLVITHTENAIFTAAQARYMARHIPNALLKEWPGNPQLAWQDSERLLPTIEAFITGSVRATAPRRVLAILLMTDIVGSTRQLARLGDASWRALLDRHDGVIHATIERHHGRLIDTAGDGTLVRFDTPGAAIDCAQALHTQMKDLGLEIRAGIHIGEIELREEGRIGGMAVHIAARVLGCTEDGATWVSRTVRDVLIGSPYRFKERGIHELKGVPSKWPLYAVDS